MVKKFAKKFTAKCILNETFLLSGSSGRQRLRDCFRDIAPWSFYLHGFESQNMRHFLKFTFRFRN